MSFYVKKKYIATCGASLYKNVLKYPLSPTLTPLAVYAAVRHAYGPRASDLRNHVSFTSKYLLESRVPDFLTDCLLCI